MRKSLWRGFSILALLSVVNRRASAGPHYSVEERLQCSDAVLDVEIPVPALQSSDEERWRRNRTLPRIWHAGKKRARAKAIAGADVALMSISSWTKDFSPVPDVVIWNARKRGIVRVLLFVRKDGDTWRYVLRSVNGFPTDQQIDWSETLSAVAKWTPGHKKPSEDCGEPG
jgi:hypothetical protein